VVEQNPGNHVNFLKAGFHRHIFESENSIGFISTINTSYYFQAGRLKFL